MKPVGHTPYWEGSQIVMGGLQTLVNAFVWKSVL